MAFFTVDFFTQVMCYTERKGSEENESLDTVTQRGATRQQELL